MSDRLYLADLRLTGTPDTDENGFGIFTQKVKANEVYLRTQLAVIASGKPLNEGPPPPDGVDDNASSSRSAEKKATEGCP